MTVLNIPIQVRRGTAVQMPAVLLVGELYFQTDTSKLYAGTGTGVTIVGGGAIAWGTITGTLSSQTDLQSVLTAIIASVASEIARAEAAETLLATITSLNNEATMRANADTTNANAISAETTRATTAEALLAPKASPALTGTPTAPTAAASTNTTQLATTAFVESEIPLRSAVLSVAGKTGTVTLVESDITSLTSDLALKAPLASPALTGSPTAPTQTALSADTKIATDAYCDSAVGVEKTRALAAEALLAPLASPSFTGHPVGVTEAALNNSTRLASTAYADAAVAVEASRATTAEATKQATLTGTGLARNTGASTELSGDVTTSGSNAATVVKVNGGSIPASKKVVGSNGSNQIVDASSYAVGETVTASQDFCLLPYDSASLTTAAGATGVMGTLNHVRAIQFNLNRKVTFTSVTIDVSITSNGNKEYIGIYSADKSTLLAEAIFTLGVSAGVKTVTIGAVTLNPGTYWLARGADQTTSSLIACTVQSSPLALFNAGSITRYGDCNGVISGGHLPSALGSITTSATSPPIVLLEP